MGKGGGGQRTPYEAPNDLTSRQKASLIDLISEGPIEGPIHIQGSMDDLGCIYLDDTPVIDGSGNSTINGMYAQWRAGTLEQPAMSGFTASANEVPVGIEVKYNSPVTRTITSPNIDRLRLTFGTQALVETKDNGDRVPTSVQLQIQIQRNGTWITEKNVTINGKRSNSPYLMAVVLDDLPPVPFSVRMIRITQDSTSDKIQNNTVWSSYSELVDISQTYPGSAVAGLMFDSEQFGNKFPRRNYLIKGRIIQVPSNYDPDKRIYSGIWDGTFKPSFTNNPAWILWDLLTHPRYGMGKRLNISEVDKFALYAIGRYCDEQVDDGFGGKEPRMVCNAYITDMRKAYDVMGDMCAMMRIMPVWNGRTLTFIQDRPSDVVWPYTNANVIDGNFQYSFSALKSRHTAVEVRFIDPDNGWKTSVELVEDDASIARFGRNVMRVDAFGCTSRGQAHRHGLWLLTTEKLETQTVEFTVGSEGLRHMPGDIIEIADNYYADNQIGGRLTHIDYASQTLTLDRNIDTPQSGKSSVTLINAQGDPQSYEVLSYPASNQIKLDTLPLGLREGGIWTLTLPSLRRRLFRAISLADNGDGSFTVIAVQHTPEKEAIVDKGAKFEPKPDTPLGGFIPPVENLSVDIELDASAWQVEASWNTPYSSRGVDFLLKLTTGDRIVGTASTTDTMYRFGGLPQGNYVLSVVPQNDRKQKGEVATTSFAINPPLPPSYIEVESGYFSLGIIPRSGGQNSLRAQYEFWFSEKQITDIREVESRAEYLGVSSMWVIQGRNLKAGHTYYIYVRSINAVGKSAFVEAKGEPNSNTKEILDELDGQFMTADAGKQLSERLDWNAETAIILSNADSQLSRSLLVKHGQSQAGIKELWQVRATDNEAWAQEVKEIYSAVGDNTSAIKETQTSITKLDEAFGQRFTEIRTEMDKAQADIASNSTAISNTNKAFAENKTQVQAKFDEQEGMIQEKMQATFEQSGDGVVTHSINITIVHDKVKYNAAGQVISAQVKNGKLESFFGYNANNFAWYNPSNGKMELFMYAKNGQFFVRDLFIEDGSITNAKIGNVIQSNTYKTGVDGWHINKNGFAEFQNIKARGEIEAISGRLKNVVIEESCEILGTLNVENLEGNIVTVTQDVYRSLSFPHSEIVELFKVKRRTQKCFIWVQGALNPYERIPNNGVRVENRAAFAYRAPGYGHNGGEADIYIDGVIQPKPNTYNMEGLATPDFYAVNEFVLELSPGEGVASIGIKIPRLDNQTTRFIMRARIIVFPDNQDVIF
ncbi:TipJ family phage tail tip protein [Proteus vulgaris]|uniref:TipJ family phage tail tip protein n=1 Tax=Proteus vulgaris TaxID=585 RepID=UPI0006596AD0|nr:phage tail protein [Proteus vulgaris]CRL61907.1 Fibronectin type III protein [Proteus vulgaris]